VIEGQLNPTERQLLSSLILDAPRKPQVLLEVGTWLGGGSTLTILSALERNGEGRLWGVEANRSIYEAMLSNIRTAGSSAAKRFTPLFGFSQEVIPRWLAEFGQPVAIDLVFLDGGNNPGEQITEFKLLDPHIPVGGILVAHDAKLRKGKWLVPYISTLDNWESKLHDVSDEGLFIAHKTASFPSPPSMRRARFNLLRMRLKPAETAATLLPAKVCGFILNLMPEGLRRRITEGR
jgi:predicted O-methyltransferase YrrM